jgi:hypothetical protein
MTFSRICGSVEYCSRPRVNASSPFDYRAAVAQKEGDFLRLWVAGPERANGLPTRHGLKHGGE